MARRPLAHTELITLESKDDQYFRTYIGDPVQEVCQRILGVRRWIKLRNAISVLSRFGYFAQTTLSEVPTLGEEFCEAQPTSYSDVRRYLLVLLGVGIDYPKEIPKPFINLLEQVHIITFNIFADHFKLSKRIANFSYTTRTLFSPPSNNVGYIYKAIGCLTFIKLILDSSNDKLICDNDMNETLSHMSQETKFSDTDSSMLCLLCSESRKEPTSTECGHIFCWYCIHKWLKDRSECPICRKPTEPSRLIYLINFR